MTKGYQVKRRKGPLKLQHLSSAFTSRNILQVRRNLGALSMICFSFGSILKFRVYLDVSSAIVFCWFIDSCFKYTIYDDAMCSILLLHYLLFHLCVSMSLVILASCLLFFATGNNMVFL